MQPPSMTASIGLIIHINFEITFHINFWVAVATVVSCALMIGSLRAARRAALGGNQMAARTVLLPAFEPILWVALLLCALRAWLLGCGPYPAVPSWYEAAVYREPAPGIKWLIASLEYFLYWFSFEFLADGFGILLVQKSVSHASLRRTLKYTFLASVVLALTTTVGLNFQNMHLSWDAQRLVDSFFILSPAVFYLLVLAGKLRPKGRDSVVPYAWFSLMWRIIYGVAILSEVSQGLVGATVQAVRSVGIPFMIYLALASDTRYWRGMGKRVAAAQAARRRLSSGGGSGYVTVGESGAAGRRRRGGTFGSPQRRASAPIAIFSGERRGRNSADSTGSGPSSLLDGSLNDADEIKIVPSDAERGESAFTTGGDFSTTSGAGGGEAAAVMASHTTAADGESERDALIQPLVGTRVRHDSDGSWGSTPGTNTRRGYAAEGVAGAGAAAGRRSGSGSGTGAGAGLGDDSLQVMIGDTSHGRFVDFAFLRRGKLIGRGATSEVYRGFLRTTQVAIKCFQPDDVTPEEVASFTKETEICSDLDHPNIVRFYGLCVQPPDICLVFELCERGSLYKLLQAESESAGWDWSRRMRMALDSARAVEYLHDFDPPYIHRDVKSPNLLVKTDYTVVLGDFGESRFFMRDASRDHLTRFVGTPQWMAPEMMEAEVYDEKVDVYALGIVLWEIVTGERPFDGARGPAVIKRVVIDNERPVVPSDCPASYARLMQRCWAKDSADRPSAAEVVAELNAMALVTLPPE